jgi:hypothetical protein
MLYGNSIGILKEIELDPDDAVAKAARKKVLKAPGK